ncbi:MAG: hypothetical protein ONB27_14820 [candidate division KSB1 bacterium]|nr:hypothetical protein [candidate division KSB1 bacterium]
MLKINGFLSLTMLIILVSCSQTHLPKATMVPVKPRVLMIIFNPIIESEGNQRLTKVLHWNDPDSLAEVYRADLYECSQGYLDYQIVKRVEVDEYPLKMDGFRYDDEIFLKCWRERKGFHQPDAVDYLKLFEEFDVFRQVENNEIDEVWCFTFPYSGFWETTMAGKNAFYCNSDPVPQTEHVSRRFITYGFNYEREVGCMLEDFGHMTESVMSHVFRNTPQDQNLWQQFTQYDQMASTKANCGNVHFAPNSERDYDWGNQRFVLSNCDDWLNFPHFKGITREVNCAEWGNGDMREHHKWWFKHLPHAEGETNGISNNWWYYIADVDRVE